MRDVRSSAVPVPDMEAAKALQEIKKQIHIPLCGGHTFLITDLPLQPMENGADKIRINPGNIGCR
ncbi:MAG: flavodoxin-dependent (E)-4-hydroxy-3-methylbut-2-enyl-diphosphate synthase [Eubacterium ramulus]